MHVMIDLETWGTTPGSDIRSIGACVFDPVTDTIGETFYIALDNPTGFWGGKWHTRWTNAPCYYRKYPLTRSKDTEQWWSEQSEEAQAAFNDPVDLQDGLGLFTIWLNSVCTPDTVPPSGGHTNLRLWSHGATFDSVLLAAAYVVLGLPVPWHYRAPRDTRTLFDAAGITDHSAWLNRYPGPMGVSHHALDDAICQARAVCAAWARIDVRSDPVQSASSAPPGET